MDSSHLRSATSSSASSSDGAHFLINLVPQSLSSVLQATGFIIPTTSATSSSANHSSAEQSSSGAEVAIRIIGEHEQHEQLRQPDPTPPTSSSGELSSPLASPRLFDRSSSGSLDAARVQEDHFQLGGVRELEAGGATGGLTGGVTNGNGNGQRYDFQPLARWVEQVLPFMALLLLVFIRQHLQGLAVTFWITAVMIKANELLRKQTALKGERKKLVIISIAGVLMLHLVGVYWWYKGEGIWKALVLVPPRKIPKFWQAIFNVMVNDVMVRQVGMAVKCVLLLTYKSTRGRHFRKQGQLLTVVEYLLLLYRALVPTPVWYRFFLNKEYGNLFSSLITGLYLTFKLTSVFEKVRTFIAAVRLLSRSEVLYGVHSTAEEVISAGDMCAICQEKMHSPITLRCKHIFCEDCVSEWFERERTCPLCRAVVKSADFKSFADGSTSLFIQFF